ncbi:MAG: 50S ribosomal protein L25/general stress protein Ctc [Bifidobacteriaceae bacterium]|nr:50S ribosomal protein L25/general stress protein Ctc [Bifidobacteriaceae bacterium]
MADEIILEAQDRTEFGKGAARRTRRAGLVPAVLHSHGDTPIHVSLPAHDAFLALRHVNAVLTIKQGSKQTLTIAREVQRNALTDALEHIDLQVVKAGEKIEAAVPVRLEGEPTSGIALLDMQDLRVLAEATHIPQSITVVVEGLNDGDSIHIRDLVLPEGVEALDDPDTTVATVTVPREVDETPAGEGEEEAEEAADEAE